MWRAFVMGMMAMVVFASGCGEFEEQSGDVRNARNRLAIAVRQFEQAESRYGPSTNDDELIKNAYWVDQMVDSLTQIRAVRNQLGHAQIEDDWDFVHDMEGRLERYLKSFARDMAHVSTIADMERSMEWLK